MKLKVKPSAKVKRRYILVEGAGKKVIEKVVLDYIGILGWARAAPVFVKESKKGVVLAVERKEVDNVRAAFEISDKKLRVVKVSGTLKGLGR